VGEVRDIRGTAEEQRRLRALYFVAPHLEQVFGMVEPLPGTDR
jgi:hypothetical protein